MERLDTVLVRRGLTQSRERAQASIMEGLVEVDGRVVIKAGTPVSLEASIVVKEGRAARYAGRGGLKLEKALRVFGISVEGLVIVDMGASTGGFTDCLLKAGAARVYAVDVGYGQLEWRLRQDPRVVCLERTNARHLSPSQFPEAVDFVTADLSFISLAKVLPVISSLLGERGAAVLLIKPQFEAGIRKVRKGVVRDPAVHREVLAAVEAAASEALLSLIDITWSPVKGPAGNIEFLGYFCRAPRQGEAPGVQKIAEAVDGAHRELSHPAEGQTKDMEKSE